MAAGASPNAQQAATPRAPRHRTLDHGVGTHTLHQLHHHSSGARTMRLSFVWAWHAGMLTALLTSSCSCSSSSLSHSPSLCRHGPISRHACTVPSAATHARPHQPLRMRALCWLRHVRANATPQHATSRPRHDGAAPYGYLALPSSTSLTHAAHALSRRSRNRTLAGSGKKDAPAASSIAHLSAGTLRPI